MTSRGPFPCILFCDAVLFLYGSTGQVLLVYSQFPLSSSKYMLIIIPTSKYIFLFYGYEQSLCNDETKLHMQTLKL